MPAKEGKMDCPTRDLLETELDRHLDRLAKQVTDERANLVFAYRELKRIAQDVVYAHEELRGHRDSHRC